MDLNFAISTNVETQEKYIFSQSSENNSNYLDWEKRMVECGITEFIEVETEDILFCSSSNLKYEYGNVVIDYEKIAEQKIQDDIQKVKQLEQKAFAQQNKIIDQNMGQFLWDMFKNFDLSVCPIAQNYKDFMNILWAQYHADKSSLNESFDYSTIVPSIDYSYSEIEAEYIANR